VLLLDWPDMQPPTVGLNFWIALWSMLPEKTAVCCHGGHGRTGTCIAALMIASGSDYYEAIETVRTKHCKKAVETVRQEEYLHGIYLETMARDLKAAEEAGDTEVADAIKDDIKYALANKPHHSTSKAVKNFSQPAVNSPPPSKPALILPVGAETKVHAGTTYVRECTDPKCPTVNCNNLTHLGWVEWDASFTAYGMS
jgi:hypothetical protein